MRSQPEILAVLGDALANELTAINQYLLHGETCARWGFERLATRFRDEAQDERQHADLLIERILFLEGTPDLQRYHEVRGAGTARAQLEVDLAMEMEAVACLQQGIELARRLGDNGTEALLMKILVAEESGVDWIESQLYQIETVGEQNYLAQQLH